LLKTNQSEEKDLNPEEKNEDDCEYPEIGSEGSQAKCSGKS
jgi:hypothetical protein